MMTHRITEQDIAGMEPIAVGYKGFDENWCCLEYDYKDENGNAEGTIHKYEGQPEICSHGLHFCLNPFDVFDYYALAPGWNKFAKVEAYYDVDGGAVDSGGLIPHTSKRAASILKIVKTYANVEEFLDDVYQDAERFGNPNNAGVAHSTKIRESRGVVGSSYSREVMGGNLICDSQEILGGNNVRCSLKITGGHSIISCSNVVGSELCSFSRTLSGCENVHSCIEAEGVSRAESSAALRGVVGAWGSMGLHGCNNITGGYYCEGCVDGFGLYKCTAVCDGLFCVKLKGASYRLFNKQVTRERYNEVYHKMLIEHPNWSPEFVEKYKEGRLQNPLTVRRRSLKEAWDKNREEIRSYFKELPEYDEKIFDIVTGLVEEE